MNDARTAILSIRRWCPEAGTHQDEDDPWCGWQHGDQPTHRLRRRRMLVCSRCEQGYFTQHDFDRHECFSAY